MRIKYRVAEDSDDVKQRQEVMNFCVADQHVLRPTEAINKRFNDTNMVQLVMMYR